MSKLILIIMILLYTEEINHAKNTTTDVDHMKDALNNIESRVAGLKLSKVKELQNSVIANFELRQSGVTDNKLSHGLRVIVNSYASEDEAKSAFDLSVKSRAVAPTEKKVYKNLTLYKWFQTTILCQIGVYVIDISATSLAEPLVMNTLGSLTEDLSGKKFKF